ncbi:MAG: hypothetical protein HQL63_06045 [Magnetococcales bacterium]|nr:hypothetical protein [Magnetococcales bacterium]MBF0321569.1 hypothetical protein [Magnetococcales bacterium]
MKNNSFGLVSVILLGFSCAGVAAQQGYRVALGEDLSGEKTEAMVAPKSEDEAAKVPNIDEVLRARIGQLQPRLSQLHNPKQVAAGDVNLKLVGFSLQALEQSERILNQTNEDYRERIISMAYVAGENRFAVIDGRLYREGDDFGDTGAKIRTIHADKVLIAGRDVRQWLDVLNPVDPVKAAPVTQAVATKAATAAESGAPTTAAAAKEKPASSVEEGVQALKGYNDMMKALQGQ